MKRTKSLTRIRRIAEIEICVSVLFLLWICVQTNIRWIHVGLMVAVSLCALLWAAVWEACYELLTEDTDRKKSEHPPC